MSQISLIRLEALIRFYEDKRAGFQRDHGKDSELLRDSLEAALELWQIRKGEGNADQDSKDAGQTGNNGSTH